MKKIGIVADNYKLDAFKKELNEAGFEFDMLPFDKDTTSIFIYTTADKISKINAICIKVETDLKRGN